MAASGSIVDLTLDSDNDMAGNSPGIPRPRSLSGGGPAGELSALTVRHRIQDMFPDICPTYLRGLVALESRSGVSGHLLLDNVVDIIVDANSIYPKATAERIEPGNTTMDRKRKRPGTAVANFSLEDGLDGTGNSSLSDFEIDAEQTT